MSQLSSCKSHVTLQSMRHQAGQVHTVRISCRQREVYPPSAHFDYFASDAAAASIVDGDNESGSARTFGSTPGGTVKRAQTCDAVRGGAGAALVDADTASGPHAPKLPDAQQAEDDESPLQESPLQDTVSGRHSPAHRASLQRASGSRAADDVAEAACAGTEPQAPAHGAAFTPQQMAAFATLLDGRVSLMQRARLPSREDWAVPPEHMTLTAAALHRATYGRDSEWLTPAGMAVLDRAARLNEGNRDR